MQPEQPEAENSTTATAAIEKERALKALARDLPPRLDAYLKALIDAAIKRCRKSGFPVQRLLAAFAGGRHVPSDFELALETVRNRSHGPTSEARVCAWLFGVAALSPDESSAAGGVLREILGSAPRKLILPATRRLRQSALRSAAIAAPSALLVSLPSWAEGALLLNPLGNFVLFSVCLFVPVFVISFLTELAAARELRFITAHALGRLDYVQAVDALSGAGMGDDSDLCQVALISLRALLPHLTPDHYGMLGPNAVPNLCRLLKEYAPVWMVAPGLQTDLLEALEKVGDSRAIPVVRRSCRQWPAGPLRQAADRTLETLEERRRRELERDTLLRGAKEPVPDPSILLRAADAQSDLRPEQLLRPVD